MGAFMPYELNQAHPIDVVIVAVPETAGSALYGMLDVLMAAGSIWQTLCRERETQALFQVRIMSTDGKPFSCGNGIPVQPQLSLDDAVEPDIVILPELWLGPDQALTACYPELMAWLRQQHQRGAYLYSACSGSVMLAESGLLDGREATSHWGYQDLFRKFYPKVQFQPQPNLCFADPQGQIVTAGGTSSWHDLAVHIIARHASPGEALRIAKVYLLKWHEEGELPFASLRRGASHDDALVQDCEAYLAEHYLEATVLRDAITQSKTPERTLKRRFKKATGNTLIEQVQNLRIEQAKRLLESGTLPVDEISFQTGYDDTAFFRRLFKRRTGLTPSHYRRLFRPMKLE